MWHSPESDFTVSAPAIVPYDEFEMYTFEITAISPRAQWVNHVIKRLDHPQFDISSQLCIVLMVFKFIFYFQLQSPEGITENDIKSFCKYI